MRIAEYPLTKAHRIRLARAFKNVARVDLSIDCVLEGQMGRAFVDDVQNPTAFKIQTGPFFYLAGDAHSSGGEEMLRNITPNTLFMPSAPGWLDAARRHYGPHLISLDRYSFSSGQLAISHLDQLIKSSPFGDRVKRMDAGIVAQLIGQECFAELADFDSAGDFAERGIGFYATVRDSVGGAAYSSLVCSKGIEVSLFVVPEYRRQGIGTALASHLVKWCLEQGQDAHWDAANPESCKLAMKLGYTHTGNYQAYYLDV